MKYKRVGIMQPYFLPYLGYFALIKHTDEWIVFDTAQFIRHGWIERNRILKPSAGWQYIKVPLVKHSRESPIKDIRIRQNEMWRELILAQIDHYKSIAPYFQEVSDFVREILRFETDSLSELNVYLLNKICTYLGIPFNGRFFSKCDLRLAPVNAPDEWALNISLAVGANEYVNPPGGHDFFDRSKYDRQGLRLTFLKANLKPYVQGTRSFQAGLSILDVMMFNTQNAILQMLDDYTVLEDSLGTT